MPMPPTANDDRPAPFPARRFLTRRRPVAIVTAAAAIALGAQATLPLGELSFTLQTFFVLLAGFLLDRRDAVIAVLLYLLAGAAGLPVFSGGSAGVGRLYGPTGGFLLSFPAMAWISGIATRDSARPAGWTHLFAFGGLATLTTLALGLGWMAYTRHQSGLEILGVLGPLLPGAVLKLTAAAGLYRVFRGAERTMCNR